MLVAFLAIHLCAIHAPFFELDDQQELQLVRARESWMSLLGTDLYSFFRPIKNMMFVAINWLYFHGGMPAVRSLPIAIGLGAACAVFQLCLRVLADRLQALAATAIWLLAPTLVSCVAWVSASNILLMTAWGAMALTCHDLAGAGEETSSTPTLLIWKWKLLAFLGFALALLSYEGAVSLVPLVFVMDWYLHPARLSRAATWRRYMVYGLELFIYLLLRHQAHSTQTILGGFSFVSRTQAMMSSSYLIWLHASTWFWPFNRMAVIGGYYWGQVSPLELITCWLGLLAAVLFALWGRRRYPIVTLGVLWFLIAFAPMSNILGFRNGPYCDSYIALASIGFAFAMTAGLRMLGPSQWKGKWRTLTLTAFTLIIAIRIGAIAEAAAWSSTWNSPLTAYERTLVTFPQAFDAMTELAKLHAERGDLREADDLAAKSIKLAPDRFSPYAVRATVAEREDRFQEALNWSYGTNVNSDLSVWRLTFQADLYAEHFGQPERAQALYEQAVACQPWGPDSLRAAYELAYLLAQQGHRDRAIALWEKLLLYEPQERLLHWNLALAYAQEGNQERAAFHRRLAGNLPPSADVPFTNSAPPGTRSQ